MIRHKFISATTALTLGLGGMVTAGSAQAGMFDMVNPSKWFGGRDRDYYYDRGYYGGPYGGYGPYGYGGYGRPYGYGGYGPYGYGAPYGYGGYGGAPSTIVVNPSSGATNRAPRVPE